MSFGSNLHDLRMKNNMNQHEFAQSIGITQAILSRYENGTVNPSIEILQRIVDVYNVSLDQLFDIPVKNRLKDPEGLAQFLIALDSLDISGINMEIADSEITIRLDQKNETTEKSCAFMKDYLEHKKEFDAIQDEEIRALCINTWIEKKQKEYGIGAL